MIHDLTAPHLNQALHVVLLFVEHTYTTGRQTLLHIAALHGREDCLSLLLQHSIDTQAVDAEGMTALLVACHTCSSSAVQALLAVTEWSTTVGTACMRAAVLGGHADTMALLLERGISCADTVVDDSGEVFSLLHCAVAWGHAECAALLLRQGADVHGLSSDGRPVVCMLANTYTLTPVLQPAPLKGREICAEQQQDTALLLLQHGVQCPAELITHCGEFFHQALALCVEGLRQGQCSRDATLAFNASRTYTAAYSDSSATSSDAATRASVVRVQLVHADTGLHGRRVYTINTAELETLHYARGESRFSVLLNLVVPPAGWTAATADGVRLLVYDGEC
jgi:Ankyrin repeats (many copies)